MTIQMQEEQKCSSCLYVETGQPDGESRFAIDPILQKMIPNLQWSPYKTIFVLYFKKDVGVKRELCSRQTQYMVLQTCLQHHILCRLSPEGAFDPNI